MNNYKKLIGEFGESLARDYLISKGYRILNMNYRNRFGEIDIVCMNKDLLIFCEIKSRYSNSFGFPIESVTYYKQNQIIKLSKLYSMSKKYFDYNIRYDIIEIIFNNWNSSYIINHIEDAFRAY